jgi:predicted enzyme related to lactoylglutathione lyase
MPAQATGHNSILIYFACEDCANEAERAVKAGGSIIQPKFNVGPYGDIAIIRDTEENMIGLHNQNMNQES